MGRPGLTIHRKFRRLARALDSASRGFGTILARGALELLWEASYEAGDPYLGDALDVEARAVWGGPDGALCQALLDAGGSDHPGFIEEGGSPWWPEGTPATFRVHDLFDHAPRYVKRRAQLEDQRRADGKTISELRAAAGRKGGLATSSKRAANGQQNLAAVVPPAPAPAPAPAPKDQEQQPASTKEPSTPAAGLFEIPTGKPTPTSKAPSRRKSPSRSEPTPEQAACRKVILAQLEREQLARTGQPFRRSGATGRGVAEFATACDDDPAEALRLLAVALAQPGTFWRTAAVNPLQLAAKVNELRLLATTGRRRSPASHKLPPMPDDSAEIDRINPPPAAAGGEHT